MKSLGSNPLVGGNVVLNVSMQYYRSGHDVDMFRTLFSSCVLGDRWLSCGIVGFYVNDGILDYFPPIERFILCQKCDCILCSICVK